MNIFDYGFKNFHYAEIGKKDWEFPEVKVFEGMEEFVTLGTDANTFTYLLGKTETVKCKVCYTKEISAPVEKGVLLGTITYELHGKVIEQFSVYTTKEVEKATFWNKVKKWLRNVSGFIDNLTNK